MQPVCPCCGRHLSCHVCYSCEILWHILTISLAVRHTCVGPGCDEQIQKGLLAISCHAPSDAFNWCWDQRMQICGQHACQILELGLEYILLGCKSDMLWCILCSCSICKYWPTKLDKGWCMHQTLSTVCKMLAWWAFVPWTNWVEAPDRGSRPRISSEGERS